jgi:nanoRNase/pAp phosphatase (c-di-AMP/oligoRNAs hydrolase)
MDDQFKQLVDSAKSILILLPTKPFFDQVAAGLGLFLALRDTKDVSIVTSTPVTVDFNRIVGINKVTQEVGNISE